MSSPAPTERAAGARPLPMPVRQVTLYEDRAELVRRVTLELPPGRHRFTVPRVTPLAGQGRLDARVEAVDGAEAFEGVAVEHVEVGHRWAPAEADRRDAMAAEREAALAAEHAADAILSAANARRARARWVLTGLVKATQQAVWAGTTATDADFAGDLGAIEARLARAEQAVADAAAAHRGAVAARERFDALTQAAAHDRLEPQTWLELQIYVEGPSEGAPRAVTLRVSMVVPCALWRPSHEAHLVGGPDGGAAEDDTLDALTAATVEWIAQATVWQQTGEAWTDVELSFSTARPGAGARLPGLDPDRIAVQPRADRKRIVLAHREENIATDKGESALPGVDDGGEARHYRAEGRVDVPSDGRPHRFPLGRFDSAATTARVVRPALSLHVFELAHLHNEGPWPLLAGPVTLRRHGAYTGTGELSFVGPGERFELAFGSDDRWTVRHRRLRRVRKRALGRDQTHYLTSIELMHDGVGSAEVVVELRLPQSEIADLIVHQSDQFECDRWPTPDEDGIARVPVVCEPSQTRTLKLGFWFEKKGELVMPDPW